MPSSIGGEGRSNAPLSSRGSTRATGDMEAIKAGAKEVAGQRVATARIPVMDPGGPSSSSGGPAAEIPAEGQPVLEDPENIELEHAGRDGGPGSSNGEC